MTKTVSIKWFPPSWLQIKANGTIIYVDPAYLGRKIRDILYSYG